MDSANLDRVKQAQDRLTEALMGNPDINGVGIGREGDPPGLK